MQFLCDQDREDFEQEKRINEWLSRDHPNRTDSIDCKHINRKGNARNTLVRANFSLDQQIVKHDARSGTFADLVAGSDGRDLENGNADYHFDEYFNELVNETLDALGFKQKEIQWLKNLWLHSETLNELLLLTSMTDSEWENL